MKHSVWPVILRMEWLRASVNDPFWSICTQVMDALRIRQRPSVRIPASPRETHLIPDLILLLLAWKWTIFPWLHPLPTLIGLKHSGRLVNDYQRGFWYSLTGPHQWVDPPVFNKISFKISNPPIAWQQPYSRQHVQNLALKTSWNHLKVTTVTWSQSNGARLGIWWNRRFVASVGGFPL